MSAQTGNAIAMSLEGGFEEVFDEAVERDPTHAATALLLQVDADGTEIYRATYTEKRVCVRALAAAFRSRLEADGDLNAEQQSIGDRVVAICMEPCVERVATILALWRLRFAFVPLGPKLPPARAHDMLRETRVLAILTFNHCTPYATSIACALDTRPRMVRFETLFATAPFRGAVLTPGIEQPLAPDALPNSPAPQTPASPGFSTQTYEQFKTTETTTAYSIKATSGSLSDTVGFSSSLDPYKQYVLRFSDMACLAERTQSEPEAKGVARCSDLQYMSGSSGHSPGSRSLDLW